MKKKILIFIGIGLIIGIEIKKIVILFEQNERLERLERLEKLNKTNI